MWNVRDGKRWERSSGSSFGNVLLEKRYKIYTHVEPAVCTYRNHTAYLLHPPFLRTNRFFSYRCCYKASKFKIMSSSASTSKTGAMQRLRAYATVSFLVASSAILFVAQGTGFLSTAASQSSEEKTLGSCFLGDNTGGAPLLMAAAPAFCPVRARRLQRKREKHSSILWRTILGLE